VVDAGTSLVVTHGAIERADEGSFASFFAGHYTRSLRLATLLTGDQTNAEDIVCEAFAKVYARWRRGQIVDVDNYLRQAVVNTLRSRWRRQATERRHDPAIRQLARASEWPARFEDQVVDRDAIWAALNELSEGQRRVLVLRYYEDLSEGEIAALLRISVGTVKSQWSRGLARLQRILGATCEETA
jgi:RNA polymerase sigma-70 factor (sigma-E family)